MKRSEAKRRGGRLFNPMRITAKLMPQTNTTKSASDKSRKDRWDCTRHLDLQRQYKGRLAVSVPRFAHAR